MNESGILKSAGIFILILFLAEIFSFPVFVFAANSPSVQIEGVSVPSPDTGRTKSLNVDIKVEGIDNPKQIVKYELYVNGSLYRTWHRNDQNLPSLNDQSKVTLRYYDDTLNYPSGDYSVKVYYDKGLFSRTRSSGSAARHFDFSRDQYVQSLTQHQDTQRQEIESALSNPQLSSSEDAANWWSQDGVYPLKYGYRDSLKNLPSDQIALLIKGGYQVLQDSKYNPLDIAKDIREGDTGEGLHGMSAYDTANELSTVLANLIVEYKKKGGNDSEVLALEEKLAQYKEDLKELPAQAEALGHDLGGAPPITPARDLDLAHKLRPVILLYYTRAIQFGSPLAIIILIIAGYRYITSAGNPEALGEAKGLMTGAIVGLLVLVLAGLIMHTIK